MSSKPLSKDFTELWTAAIDAYQKKTGVDFDDVESMQDLIACDNPEDVLSALEVDMFQFKAFREGDPKWVKLREQMKGIVRIVLPLSDAIAEVASFLVRGGISRSRTYI
jgi:hypothetical protein